MESSGRILPKFIKVLTNADTKLDYLVSVILMHIIAVNQFLFLLR